MGKITICPKNSILFKLLGFSVQESYGICSSFTGLHGEKKKILHPISIFLKGLNNCKLNVNQTLLGVGNVVLCQKVVEGDLLMESGKKTLSASRLFCLWAHKFSNRPVLSWVLNYTDSCVFKLPYS